MTLLPPTVARELAERLGRPVSATPLTGGDVNHVALVEAGPERLVVKWKPNAPAGLFAAEADGLRRLQETKAIRVPTVIAWDDASDPPWLAMEFVPTQPPPDDRAFGLRLGEGLAALHHGSLSPNGCFGLDRDNYLGAQPQRNAWADSWPAFYRDRRLIPQMDRARSLGLLPDERERRLGAIMARIETLMDGFTPQPALIHGDLWSGNFLSAGDEPVLIDPAVYYAEREVEIAYTELFGGFPLGFHAAYEAAFPLDPGYARRRPLHQIYPLLIHLSHFGETYGSSLDQACRDALG